MKVRELIEKLQALSQDLDVYVKASNDETYAYLAVDLAEAMALVRDDKQLAMLGPEGGGSWSPSRVPKGAVKVVLL